MPKAPKTLPKLSLNWCIKGEKGRVCLACPHMVMCETCLVHGLANLRRRDRSRTRDATPYRPPGPVCAACVVCGGRDGVPVGVAADRHFISKCHLGICYYRTLSRADSGVPSGRDRYAGCCPAAGAAAGPVGAADPRRTRGTYGTSVLQNNALTRGVYNRCGPVLRDAMRPPRAGRGSAHKG